MTSRAYLLIIPLLLSCASGPSAPAWAPRPAADEPLVTLVWVGRGEAERIVDGRWRRTPAFDYDFTVEQVRFRGRWRSVKSLRRLHPDYDGSAGPRAQTYFFEIEYAAPDEDRVTGQITSTLGPGTVATDPDFRRATMELRPDISAFAPFDTYRITQSYGYEDGTLTETVELLDHEDGREVPWVRNRERARLFAAHRFAEPPTRADHQ